MYWSLAGSDRRFLSRVCGFHPRAASTRLQKALRRLLEASFLLGSLCAILHPPSLTAASFPTSCALPCAPQPGIDMSTAHHIASTSVSYSHSFRLTFTIHPGRVELVSLARVAMRAPAPATPPPSERQSGFWVELRGDKGELLYHRALRNPLPDSLEVFDDEKNGTIRRVPTNRTEAKFDVIVPDLAAASDVVVHGIPTKSDARGPSRPLIKLSMEELRRTAAAQDQQIRPR
jgi:hypothetical protein